MVGQGAFIFKPLAARVTGQCFGVGQLVGAKMTFAAKCFATCVTRERLLVRVDNFVVDQGHLVFE